MLGHESIVALNVLECDRESAASRHRIAGIDRQVQQCRFELRWVDLANEQPVRWCDLQSNALADCPPDQRLKLTNQRVHIDRLRSQVLPSRKRQQLLSQSLAALGRVPYRRKLPLQPIVVANAANQKVNVSENYRQQIIEVMRDAPRELADASIFFACTS